MPGDPGKSNNPRGIIISLLVGLLFSSFAPAAVPAKNKYYVLENGLKVFLEERDKLPLVNIVAAVNVGSKDEEKESNGLVHLLEHLVLFAGSQSSSPGALEAIIKKNGILFNAHTGNDQMTIEISTPAEFTPVAFKLLQEKLFNLRLTPGDLAKEKKVILEELSQVEDEPDKLGMQLTLRELFSGHPYEKPVAGEKNTIENVSLEELERFYKKYFIPANCALSVVGDFNIETTMETIKETIKEGMGGAAGPKDIPIPLPPLPRPVFPLVPAPKQNVEMRKELDINQAHLFIGFVAPGLNRADKLPMDVLTRMLGKGISPLLYSAFKGWERPSESVKSLDVQYIALNYGGAVLIHLVLEAKKIAHTKRQILNFLKELKSYPFSKRDYLYPLDPGIIDYLETTKAWMQLVYRQYIERESDLAVSYARYMLTYDDMGNSTQQENQERKGTSYGERLATLKSSDLQSVAANYFSGKKYVTVIIAPKTKKSK
ncbi:MAG TPA: pitrilysin family protein [Candidatus Kapabacteria bacterium]|nr:pitrilysin family protein [Candidatus Kapabacteria bacterium]